VGATKLSVVVDGTMLDQSNQEREFWDVPKQRNLGSSIKLEEQSNQNNTNSSTISTSIRN
jgi:hypothetical protein